MTRDELNQRSKEEIIELFLEQSAKLAEMAQNLANLKETLEELKRMLFSSKSEKKRVSYDDPNQMTLADLFNEFEFLSNPSAEEPTVKEVVEGFERTKPKKRNKKSSYEELYDQLPTSTRKYYAAEKNRLCPVCGSELERLGWEVVRTELQINPAEIRKVEILQEKVHCRKCFDDTGYDMIFSAEVPEPLIPHSIASPTTVAYVMYQKYINSMPLYRQEKDWMQMGVKISRATLANWCITCGLKYMKPVYEALIRHLLSRQVNVADETPCQVLKEDGRTAQQKSYMWLHCTSNLDDHPPIMIYEYAPGRQGEVATKFYQNYKGKYIITEGYQGYNHLPNGVVRCGCLAHFRRKFYQAIPAEDRKGGRSQSIAAKIVSLCDEIFKIEKGFTELSPEERKKEREGSQERDIWKEIWETIELVSVSSGSLLGKAVTYALNQKVYMENYFLDGAIPVSNNFTESCGARPYAVGRKNFYFHDTVKGAEASSIIYSLALTAKYNGLNVFKYLQMVLLHMPSCLNKPEGIEMMMPWSEQMKRACVIK